MSKGLRLKAMGSYVEGLEDGQLQGEERANYLKGELFRTYREIEKFSATNKLTASQRNQLNRVLNLITIGISTDDARYNEGGEYSFGETPQPYYIDSDNDDEVWEKLAKGEKVVEGPTITPQSFNTEIETASNEPYIDVDNDMVYPRQNNQFITARDAIYQMMNKSN